MEWIVAAIAAGLLALALGAWVFGHGGSARSRALRAGGAEAGERSADAFHDFRDWLRRGR